MFASPTDKPLFQAKFLKVGKVGKKERIMVVSQDSMYLLDRSKIIEKGMIQKINHVILSSNTPEILIYFVTEKDWVLRFSESEVKLFTEVIRE